MGRKYVATLLTLLVPSVLVVVSTQAFGQASPHVSVKTAFGPSTYKSTMLQSNDTGFTMGYGFGVSSGGERGVSMGLEREQSTFAFPLNNSSLTLNLQDVDFAYRWSMLQLGLMVTETAWYAKAPPDANGDDLLDQDSASQEYLDLLATGYGARLGLLIPMARRNQVYVDLRYGTTSRVQQAIPETSSSGGIAGTSPVVGRVVSMGPRLTIDIGTSIVLTRDVLSFITGYRYRTYSMTIASKTFNEAHTSTYIGLQAGWMF